MTDKYRMITYDEAKAMGRFEIKKDTKAKFIPGFDYGFSDFAYYLRINGRTAKTIDCDLFNSKGEHLKHSSAKRIVYYSIWDREAYAWVKTEVEFIDIEPLDIGFNSYEEAPVKEVE